MDENEYLRRLEELERQLGAALETVRQLIVMRREEGEGPGLEEEPVWEDDTQSVLKRHWDVMKQQWVYLPE